MRQPQVKRPAVWPAAVNGTCGFLRPSDEAWAAGPSYSPGPSPAPRGAAQSPARVPGRRPALAGRGPKKTGRASPRGCPPGRGPRPWAPRRVSALSTPASPSRPLRGRPPPQHPAPRAPHSPPSSWWPPCWDWTTAHGGEGRGRALRPLASLTPRWPGAPAEYNAVPTFPPVGCHTEDFSRSGLREQTSPGRTWYMPIKGAGSAPWADRNRGAWRTAAGSGHGQQGAPARPGGVGAGPGLGQGLEEAEGKLFPINPTKIYG